jgi:hypothetical protein
MNKRFFRIDDLSDNGRCYVVASDSDDMRRVVTSTCLEFGQPSQRLPEAEAAGSVVITEVGLSDASSVMVCAEPFPVGRGELSLSEACLGELFIQRWLRFKVGRLT